MAVTGANKAIDTQAITEKVRRELLKLFESVGSALAGCIERWLTSRTGTRQEELSDREVTGWYHWLVHQVQHSARIWRRQSLLLGEPECELESTQHHIPC